MNHMTTGVNFGFIPQMTVGDRVRILRRVLNLEQGELAEISGVGLATIGRIESGQGTPRRATLIAIAVATGVNREWLETGKTPAGDNPDGGSECAIRDLNPEPADFGTRSLYAA